MNKCQNPLCGKGVRPPRKFCPGCSNFVRQQNYRARHGRPLVPIREMFKKKTATGTASVDRLKKRPLFSQDKDVIAFVQAPPPESEELTKAIAKREAGEAEWYRRVEEKVRSLLAKERTIRNLRAVYEGGMTFEMACRIDKFRSSRKREAIKEQNPGMFLSGLCDGPNGLYEWEYAREFLQQRLMPDEPLCKHGVAWWVECNQCDLDIDDGEIAQWDMKQSNTVLAKLDLSVWAGKSKLEGYYGEGRAVEGIEARSHNPRAKMRDEKGRVVHVNAADSFEQRDEKPPDGQGQINSRPDRNYAGKTFGLGEAVNAPLESYDNPQATQADVIAEIHGDSKDAEPLLHRTRKIQDFVSPEAELAHLDMLNNREDVIQDRAHERIKESSSDAEVERIIDGANRKITALDDAAGPAVEADEELFPEERIEEPEQEASDDEAVLTPEEP
jgi:hypothetical protein